MDRLWLGSPRLPPVTLLLSISNVTIILLVVLVVVPSLRSQPCFCYRLFS